MENIVEKEPKSSISESYRMLRTNIHYSSFDNKIRTVLVTSAVPGEGKSTTVGNLSITFEQEGKKVLLVDCDLRKPTIHKNFYLSNKVGLSDYMTGQATLEECTVIYKERLHIITSGKIPPNPAEMLSSQKMREFLDEVSKVYDMVIIDSPPVMAVTDAQILSTYVDGVVLIIAFGKVDKKEIVKAKEKFAKVNANIIGAVFNKSPIEKKGYKYGKGRTYYYYDDEKLGKKKKGRRKKT